MRGYAQTIKLALALLISAVLAFSSSQVCAAPQEQGAFPEGPRPDGDGEYFATTGFWVWGPFYDFFTTYGGLRIFGYPRTQLYYDPDLGLWAQYFDNARMEWHPGNTDPYRVQLGLIGVQLDHTAPPEPDRSTFRLLGNYFHQYFEVTGHSVSFAFLDYFRSNGGVDLFGYPISEPRVEGGYLVQYFQRMRLEWHPERSRNDYIIPGELGNEYIYARGVSASVRVPETAPRAIATSLNQQPIASADIRAVVTVGQATIGRGEDQKIVVRVTDLQREPLVGARVTVSVLYGSEVEGYEMTTDANGMAQVVFVVRESAPLGQRIVVDIDIEASGNGRVMTAHREAFFTPWR